MTDTNLGERLRIRYYLSDNDERIPHVERVWFNPARKRNEWRAVRRFQTKQEAVAYIAQKGLRP